MIFNKWNFIGAVGSFILGGPLGLCIFLFGSLFFMLHMTKRGILFVQSYVYLNALSQDNDIGRANQTANNFNIDTAKWQSSKAIAFADTYTNGMQLPVILKARKEGFMFRGISFIEICKSLWHA